MAGVKPPMRPAELPLSVRPFSLTHVMYTDGDATGYLLAATSLLPVAISIAYATLFLSRRDMHTLTLGIGQIANEVLNYVLKHWVAEHRPAHELAYRIHEFAPRYGMPSNHAQFMGFTCVYVLLWAHLRLRDSHAPTRILLQAGVLVATALVSASRLYLGYHTPLQVGVGLAVGGLAGAGWYIITNWVLRPLFPRVVEWRISTYLLLRDCSNIDAVTVEYEATRRTAAAAEKRSTGRAA